MIINGLHDQHYRRNTHRCSQRLVLGLSAEGRGGRIDIKRLGIAHAGQGSGIAPSGMLYLTYMGQPEVPASRYTAEEYFALEAQSTLRHEFFEGEVFAMVGESIAHNTISLNVAMGCRQALRGRQCRVQIEGIQLAVEANRHYTYPDIVVSCDPQDQHERRRLHNPTLIVEVLSPSTEAYDRGLKFNQYKKLPSLRHYLLVSQKTWLVEWFQLTENGVWGHTALAEAEDAVVIPELNLTMSLVQIYEDAGVAPMQAGFTAEEAE